MKLPATLFPSLSASTTTRSAAAPGATASGFGARLGTAFGDALGEALGDAGANTADGLSTEESAGASTANEPAETSGATLPAHGGQLAQAGSERAPANDAAMTQFWAAAQPPESTSTRCCAHACSPNARGCRFRRGIQRPGTRRRIPGRCGRRFCSDAGS